MNTLQPRQTFKKIPSLIKYTGMEEATLKILPSRTSLEGKALRLPPSNARLLSRESLPPLLGS